MKMKSALVGLAALVLGATGCIEKQHPEYLFEGEIDGEKITFVETTKKGFFYTEVKSDLEVVDDTGTTRLYWDNDGNELQVDGFCIMPKGHRQTCYSPKKDPGVWEAIRPELQEQFDGYLEKIKEHKEQRALDHIKK